MRTMFQTFFGQIIWAGAQAAIVFLLAHYSAVSAIGLYTFSLSIFAPLCILGGFNLRVALAADRDNGIDVGASIAGRVIIAVASLIITVLCMYYVDKNGEWVSVSLLLSLRVVDQVSDVIIGLYQRDNDNNSIALSFASRGLSNIIPLSIAYIVSKDLLVAAATSAIVTLTVAYFVDLRTHMPTRFFREVASLEFIEKSYGVVRRSAMVAFYPFFDNLHYNSLRYAVLLGGSLDELGRVGIAQTLFVPFQLLGTSVGFGYLNKAVSLSRGADDTSAFARHALTGIACGFAVTLSFLTFSGVVPDVIISSLFGNAFSGGRYTLVLLALAMLPLLPSGFVALSLAGRGAQLSYTVIPIVGIIVFWILIAALFIFHRELITFKYVAILFLVSGIVRLSVGIYCISR